MSRINFYFKKNFIMKKLLFITMLSFLLFSCNASFIGGFIQGVNSGMSTPSEKSSVDLKKDKKFEE